MSELKLIEMVKSHKDGKQRIISAFNETNKMISKELGYSKDLQKAEYLDSLKSHAAKLTRVLNAIS